MIYFECGKPWSQAATLFFGGAIPPDERKGGVANDDYIFRFCSDRNIHCCPYWIVLHNFQRETKIAATTAIVTADAVKH